jgi:hypothetical protein
MRRQEYGPSGLTLASALGVGDDVVLRPDEVAHAVEQAVLRRRRSFRWCRTCRRVTPPEHMHDSSECQGCAERYRGVVH